jgi:Ca2+-transporting ATPase
MALASLPPEESVMKEKPRKTTDNIITPKMSSVIAAISVLFLVVLMSLIYIFKCNDVQSLDILWSGTLSYTLPQGGGVLSAYELSLFFTIFVMLQLWNMFNAKAYLTRRSAFCSMSKSQSFAVIVLVIILGQIIIVNFGGAMFNVVPISFADWLYIVLGTSAVLVVGEIYRLFLTISKG